MTRTSRLRARYRSPTVLLPSEAAIQVLESSEQVLLARRAVPKGPVQRALGPARRVFDPLFLIAYGAGRTSVTFWTGMACFITVPLILYVLVKPLHIAGDDQLAAWLYVLWFFVLVALSFGKPSAYVLSGYSSQQVRDVCSRSSWNVDRRPEFAAQVAACLTRAETETNARLTAIRWVIGAITAAAAYLVKRGIDAKDAEWLGYALVPGLLAGLLALLLSMYARAAVSVYGLAHAAVQLKVTRSRARD